MRKWILIYYDIEPDANLFKLSVVYMKKKFNIKRVYVYTKYVDHFLVLDDFIEAQDIDIVENCHDRLAVINNFLLKRKNIIFTCCILGTTPVFPSIIDPKQKIMACCQDLEENNILINLSQHFGFNKLISSRIMIIPFSEDNLTYLRTSQQMVNSLRCDRHLAVDISLTINDLKFHAVCPMPHGIVYLVNDDATMNLIKEVDCIWECDFNVKCITRDLNIHSMIDITLPISYDSSYFFYPCLDISADRSIFLPPDPIVINTNGYSPVDQSTCKTKLFKRFNCPHQGLYVKKNQGEIKIPLIMHHVWLSTVNDDVINSWNKMLPTWGHMIWTDVEIAGLEKWGQLFASTDGCIKKIVAMIAVLDIYGGIAIFEDLIPLRKIPEDLLIYDFAVSFQCHCLDFNYDVIISAPHSIVIYEMHGLIQGENGLRRVHELIMMHHDAFIFPGHYFEQTRDFPTLCYRPKKLILEDPVVKPALKRNYRVNPQGIINSLHQNPRDMLKN